MVAQLEVVLVPDVVEKTAIKLVFGFYLLLLVAVIHAQDEDNNEAKFKKLFEEYEDGVDEMRKF